MSQRFQLLHPGDERFATEIEKSIYNVAIANQDGGTGLRYHTMLEGKKERATHENTCCEGQGARLLGSLPEHIYSIAPDGLYVHLYEPSTVRWEQDGQPMELSIKTSFPFDSRVNGTIKVAASTQACIRIRTPSWAATEMKVSVNGKVSGLGKPGSYLTLNRPWSDGDVIDFILPAQVRIKRYNGVDQIPGKTRYSFEYGPVLLAAVGSAKVDFVVDKGREAEHLASELQALEGSPLHFTLPGNPDHKLIPYWEIAEQEFTCYPTITVRT
jgi:DUF1680 family protein